MDCDINHIIQESLKGDKIYQEILLKKLLPLIYKSIRKYCGRKVETEDLIQEGYIVILKSLKSFDENKNIHFLGYVKSNLKYFYLNYLRKSMKERQSVILCDSMPEEYLYRIQDIDRDNNEPLKYYLRAEEMNKLYESIGKLSDKEQKVIYMYCFEGMTMSEISNNLKIAYRTAIGRKYTALKKLRKMMSGYGGENYE
jgi:RNA polymerase sporulation-specific sigma factor